ncbi:MAG TPA: hypothetical protein VFE66_02285, partial [Bacteroidales bacterium]|nr:hypothetical protein [Bacteroidales bacterium]
MNPTSAMELSVTMNWGFFIIFLRARNDSINPIDAAKAAWIPKNNAILYGRAQVTGMRMFAIRMPY